MFVGYGIATPGRVVGQVARLMKDHSRAADVPRIEPVGMVNPPLRDAAT